jgi:hypothetical protein
MSSLIFSISSRNLTTSYIMQRDLYLACVHTILDLFEVFSPHHCVLVTSSRNSDSEFRDDMHFVISVSYDMSTSVHIRTMDDCDALHAGGP